MTYEDLVYGSLFKHFLPLYSEGPVAMRREGKEECPEILKAPEKAPMISWLAKFGLSFGTLMNNSPDCYVPKHSSLLSFKNVLSFS